MTQFAYNAETWAALSKNPADRSEAVSALAQKLGARVVGLYYTMGEYDGVLIAEAPDDVTALALVMAAVAPGHIRATRTARLYTPAEAMQAMRKAGGASFQAPRG
jgi:uncharacterized protein with GYD domain